MGPVDAFKKPGDRPSPYDWSVLSEVGCCLALWRGEIAWKREDVPVFDTRVDAGPGSWRTDRKALLRLEHLKVAQEKWGGKVDVVLRDGIPEMNDGTAEAWDASKKCGWWICDFLDPNGEFVVRIRKSSGNHT